MDPCQKLLADVRRELAEDDARAHARQVREAVAAARRFLEHLDPESQEGLFFDALAEAYPTRVEAAIVYLREVKGLRGR